MTIKKERKYLFLAFFYLSLTFLLIFFILKFGLKVAIKISEFIHRGQTPHSSPLENILPEPQFFPLPEATNSAVLVINGYSLSNHRVEIYLNDFSIKTLEADSEGKFSEPISLSLGQNEIYAITVDKLNRQSLPSKKWNVFYSNTPPYLEIIEPPNNSLIRGKNNLLSIKGKTNVTSRVNINNHLIIIKKNGSFEYPVKLQNGENKFKIICLDPAQNKTEIDFVLNYQP